MLALAPSALSAVPEPLELGDAVRLAAELGGSEEHPDANTIIGFDRTHVSFDETGAYVEFGHAFTKILTEEGRDDNGSISFNYHRRYGSVEIVMARVIKPDGTEIVVTDDLITDGTSPQVSAMNIFEADFRELTLVFPGLEVGDATEFIVRQDYEPLVENGFTGIYFMQYVDPIVESTVVIEGPEKLPLMHVVKDGDVDFVEVTDGGTTTYSWTATDIPVIEKEEGMAPPRQIAARLIVSTMHTWNEASRYIWDMVHDKCEVTDDIRDLVAEITEGIEDQEGRIRAIHYWIIENVRYLGIAMDRGVFLEPHEAQYTLEKQYGICRDKSVLMITMLKEIGVPSWMVAINPSHRMDTEIPTLYFEHGIVAIEGPDGGYVYMDPTLEESREVSASYTGDRNVLLITEEGNDLRTVPHVPASANSGRITDLSSLAEDGGVTGSVVITGGGFYEIILRMLNKNAGEQQLRMAAEDMVNDIYPGARMTDFSVTDADDLYEATRIEISYDIDDYALDAGPYRLFRIPGASGSFEILSGYLFGDLVGLPEREYPVEIGVTLGVEEIAEIELPEGYTVENTPDSVDFSEGVISLSMDYEYVPPGEGEKNGRLRYRRVFGIESFQISPDDYQHLKEAVRLASRSAKGEVILKRDVVLEREEG